jgi:hypothetical protein
MIGALLKVRRALVIIPIVLMFSACSDQQRDDTKTVYNTNQDAASMPDKREHQTERVDVEVMLVSKPVLLAKPCIVKVKIRNSGSKPVLINKRMAIGYETSQARELFVSIFRKGSDEQMGKPTQLYERSFSQAEDYVWLNVGMSQVKEFDLFEWYELPGAGDYEIQVFYQADEPMAAIMEDLINGIAASERIALTIAQ